MESAQSLSAEERAKLISTLTALGDTADRKNGLNMIFCGYGRFAKKEIVESFNKPLPPDTILCSDGHVSYKGYASDNHLKHVV